MKYWIACALFFSANLYSTESDVEKRVYAYLTIKDPFDASDEALAGLQKYPTSLKLWEAYLKALSARGDEAGLLLAWDRYRSLNPKQPPSSEALENMAWGIIQNGYRNSSPLTRMIAVLAAFIANDSRGVDILCLSLNDPHAGIRCAGAELSSRMKDGRLCDEVLRRLNVEKDVVVQLELTKAVGCMGIKESRGILLQLISQPGIQAELRAAAIESLLDLMDDIDPDQLNKFVVSDRAGLRLLAVELIAYLGSARDLDLLVTLTEDTNNDVRTAALQAMGVLELTNEQGIKVARIAENVAEDPDPTVGISAAWLLTLKEPEKGQTILRRWLNHEAMDVRLMAAGALVSAGRYGRPLLDDTFRTSKDRFVRVNLALGMISLRIDSFGGCEVLQVAMEQDKSKWMKEEKGLFSYIGPSKVKFKEGMPNYPEAVNQLLRLELINMMAMLRYPLTQQVVASFLRERSWGVTGLASALLLTEGDESAVKLVEELLKDPQHKVRAQAALILGLWGSDEAAVNVLIESYETGHRDLKEQILEALGNIQSPLVVPFLIARLHEQSQTLRLIAASSLLRTLNN